MPDVNWLFLNARETKLWKVTTIDRPIGMLIIVEMRPQPPPVDVGWGRGL